MNRTWLCLAVVAVLFAGRDAYGQRVRLQGGAVTLVISAAVAGSDPVDVTDATNQIRWDRHATVSKIVVSTSAPGQSFDLFVEVTNIRSQRGVATGEVQLVDGAFPVDLVRDIPRRRAGRGTLSYRGSAPAAFGNSTTQGDDVHVVTYTLIAQ